MFQIDLLTLLASFGTLLGLVFSLIFWIRNKGISNRIFAILLLVVSVRFSKNVFAHLEYLNPEFFSLYQLLRVGASHQFAIGPLLYIYVLSKQSNFRWNRNLILHFTPYFLFVILSPIVEGGFLMYVIFYLSYLSILGYLTFSVWVHIKNSRAVNAVTRNWLTGVLLVTSLLLLIHSPVLFNTFGYTSGGILYLIVLIVIGYLLAQGNEKLPFLVNKYETSSLGRLETQCIKEQLEQMIRKEKAYLDPALTLVSLSDLLSVKHHHLSQVINQEFQMSFSEYINSYRLKEAREKLQNPNYSHLKIASIAYDSGFNSLPTFNTLFKKVNRITPSQYRTS
ncbi:MAG: helix-turn-helix transcriptional regulator [Cyclobacteriaceae bacterium]